MNLRPEQLAGLLDAAASGVAERFDAINEQIRHGSHVSAEYLVQCVVGEVAAKTLPPGWSPQRWRHRVQTAVRRGLYGCLAGDLLARAVGSKAAADALTTLPVSLRPRALAVIDDACRLRMTIGGREVIVPFDYERN